MIFRDIELSDRDWLDKKFKEDNKKACEFCFANNYLWRKYFPTQIATEGDCVILRYYAENDAMYVFPIGNGDKKKALEQLFLYGQAKGEQIHLYGLLDYEVEQLKEWYPKHFRYEADRDMFDYIYETEHLANLSGKKFHGKRNHIARFMDDDDWEYEKLNSENLHECIDMNNNWIQKKYDDDAWSQEVQDEYDVVKGALIDYKRLGLVGGVLKKYAFLHFNIKDGIVKMDVDLIFKIAAIGIIVSVLNQVLIRSGREEQATMTTLAGLIVVLMMMIEQISLLFDTVKTVFGL